MTKKENQPRRASAEDKRQMTQALKQLFESVAPTFRMKGIEILRKLGLGDEALGKLSDLEGFSKAVLQDSERDGAKITVEDVRVFTALMADVQRDPSRFFKPAFRQMIKDMPRIRGGGRPLLTPTQEEAQKLRDQVLKLMRDGEEVKLSAALRRVAKKAGVSFRHIQRVWYERKKEGSRFHVGPGLEETKPKAE